MSRKHQNSFEAVKAEHGDVVSALRTAAKDKGRGRPGAPDYDPQRLESAIGTADDAYALLLIASAEAFMRQYLVAIGKALGEEPKLSNLIDKCFKEFNSTKPRVRIRPEDKEALHGLRVSRNKYAHGHETGVFPTVPRVAATVAKFFDQIP